jgi:hypothetical protein
MNNGKRIAVYFLCTLLLTFKFINMKIDKKILAIIILISLVLIGFTMMFIYIRIIFYLFLGCITLVGILTWCLMALDNEI